MNKWVSVKDRLPYEKQSEITHDFEYVLCATTFGDVRAYKFGVRIGWKEPHFWNGSYTSKHIDVYRQKRGATPQ